MLAIDKVLIPVDFSDSGRDAVARGLDLARQFGAEVHLLYVILLADAAPLYPVFDVPADTTKLYEEAEAASKRRLDELVQSLGAEKTVQKVLRHASAAAPAIIDYAKQEGVDLIAMGTHGRRGYRRFLLGSVAEEVVRQAPCSVATFGPAPGSGKAKPERPDHILAAVDFSDHSKSVIAVARELGSVYHATVHLLHVVPHITLPVYYELGGGAELYGQIGETRQQAEQALHELVQETPGADVEFQYHVTDGDPASEILRCAEETKADMAVLATHGLTGLTHLLLGSVAEKVLRQAPCPVLTVRAFGKSLLGESAA